MIINMAPKPGPVFYPKYLDISPDESVRFLRQLELEAHAAIISALRSQGDLTKEKKSLLTEICACLGITEDRHRAEVRRAVNDEKLATIALHNSGYESVIEWIKEGRRIVPLPHRPLEITAYMEEADRVAKMIAKENEALQAPKEVNWESFTKRDGSAPRPPTEPAEMKISTSTQLHSSLYCCSCLSKQNDTMDVCTSTEDLILSQKCRDIALDAPSASDSYVYLPSGTTVRVSTGKQEKEEQDAYSFKPNQAGNFDFGNAPEINLSGRASKRKRKKSVSSAPNKEGSVTIRQVIRPNSTSIDDLTTSRENEIKPPEYPQPQEIEKPSQRSVKLEMKRRHTSDDQSRRTMAEQVPKPKRQKPASQTGTIQHTPVPPEHLYAVGANTKSKQRQLAPPYSEEDEPYIPRSKPPPEYSVVSTEHSPTKHLGLYSSRMSPLSPSYYPGLGSSWSSGTAPREISTTSEPVSTFSRGFHYSPSAQTRPFYRPPGIVQTTYKGRAMKPTPQRHRSTPTAFSFTKKPIPEDMEHQSILKRISVKKDSGPAGIKPTGMEEVQRPHKIYRPNFSPTGQYITPMHQPPPPSANVFTLPTLEMKQEHHPPPHPPQPLPHSSSLEELASVSLMASALSTSTIVETGLAPVSAIVSRVTSPAPGQVSSAPGVKKSATRPMIVSRIQSEEAPSVQLPRLAHAGPTHPSTFIAAKQGPALLGANPNSKLKFPGSVSGQHPVMHQVHLAVTSPDNGTVSNVPINFTSALPRPGISSPAAQVPRVLSTIAGKPHTLLKSSAGSVITVTAKPLPGAKTSVSTIGTSASIVKPQIGQKTSIIVVHKAPGSKIGKSVSAAFPTLGTEGSKVITVSTKNLASSELPRLSAESSEENAPESALGSIQGLVSNLSSTGMVRKAKVIGGKPKFVTMPIHKKPIVGKIGEPTKAKIIQNVIRAPGKVLVKTCAASSVHMTTRHLRTIPASHVIKPVIAHQSSSAVQDPTVPGPDIVAAALSQSIGASVITSTPDSNPGSLPKTEGSPTANIIKVATSTPAASTIKAFAATYQKNSSTAQPKQILTAQSITTVSPSFQDKSKVFLSTLPSQLKSQPMLFTPNQPQVHTHRSPQSGSIQKLRPSYPPTAMIKSGQSKMIYQSTSPQSIMHVKVIGHPSTSPQTSPRQWQPNVAQEKVLDETAVQTKILQDIMDSSTSPQPVAHPPPTSDRATFIYQYHPTPKLVTNPGPAPIPISTLDSGDLITLHSISSESTSTGSKPESLQATAPTPKPNLVKISRSSTQTSTAVRSGPVPSASSAEITVADNRWNTAFGEGQEETLWDEVLPSDGSVRKDLPKAAEQSEDGTV